MRTRAGDRPCIHMYLAEAIEKLSEGIPTTIMLCFIATPREKFINEVIERVKTKIGDPEFSRMYLMFQQGISKKKSKEVWEECARRASTEIDIEAVSSLNVHSFGNVPTEIMLEFLEKTDALEVV